MFSRFWINAEPETRSDFYFYFYNRIKLWKGPMKKTHRSFPTALLLSPLIFLLSPELLPICEAVWLNIPHTISKCVSEEIQTNVVVLADYIVISDEHSIFPTVSVKVSILDSNYEILNLELCASIRYLFFRKFHVHSYVRWH